jgi:hypothetical protein
MIPGLEVDVCCDFNVAPLVWTLGQHRGDKAWTFDEVVIEGSATTAEAAARVIAKLPDSATHISIYGDASGKARSTKSKRSDYETIRAVMGQHYGSFELQVPGSNPPVRDRVNAFNAMLRAADGTVRYSVHPQCEYLVRDLARVKYRAGTSDIDKTSDRTLSHASDAEGYRLVSLFPVGVSRDEPLARKERPQRSDPIMTARF